MLPILTNPSMKISPFLCERAFAQKENVELLTELIEGSASSHECVMYDDKFSNKYANTGR